ncbi:MAG: ATP-binding protein, partial [Bdellovibrionota bacterium]
MVTTSGISKKELRLVIVSRDPCLNRSLKKHLLRLPDRTVEMSFCINPAHVLEQIKKIKPEVLFLSDELGKRESVYLIKHIEVIDSKLPVIALGKMMSKNVEFMLAAGASDFLFTDQINLGILEHVLRHALISKEQASRMRLLTLAIESVGEAIIVTNKQGQVTYVNPAFSYLTGFDPTEVIGKNPRLWKSDRHPRLFYEKMWAQIQSGRTWTGEVLNRKKDETTYEAKLTISPIITPSGEIEGFVGVHSDITAFKLQERELIGTREKAIEASNLKSEFLANLSHEIRTPLSAVVSVSELLSGTDLAEDQREFAEIIKSSSQALLTIVRDVLDFSKIEAGKIDLDSVTFELRKMICAPLDMLRFSAQAKGLKLKTKWDATIPKMIKGDSGRMTQILVNLINNAIKFTDQGSVEVHVHRKANWGRKAVVRFEVIDTGPGFTKEEGNKLFRRFSQIQGAEKNKQAGSGLGLVISRQFVELLGGKIGYLSKVGQGSTFWFELPLVVVEPEGHPDLPRVPDSMPAHDSSTVLLVDDHPLNLKVFAKVLERLSFKVDAVSSGRAAIELFRKRSYGIVFMDCQMPEMSGFETALKIRELEKRSDRARTPILALTANVLGENRDR